MGILERKERERQEMRELIVREATQVFLEGGYEKTSLRSLAERIEYSPATIYLYFKDKDELFYAMHERAFDKFYATLSVAQPIANPWERLAKMADLYIEFAAQNPEFYHLMLVMEHPVLDNSDEPVNWDCGFRTFNLLKSTIEECIGQGYMKKMDVNIAAVAIFSFMHGIVSLVNSQRLKMYPKEQHQPLMRESVAQMMRLVQA
jgi:AcrR family transcriptional regulator